MAGNTFTMVASFAVQHPYQFSAAILITITVITRLVTGFRFGSKAINLPNSLLNTAISQTPVTTIPTVPYYFPFVGHIIPFAMGFAHYVGRLSQKYGIGALALNIGGRKHIMITSPGLAKQIMHHRNIPVSIHGLVYHFLRSFWDDGGAIEAMDPEFVWGDLHTVLNGMLREEFVTTALRRNTEALENGGAWNLISGTPSQIDMSSWERAAQVEILETVPSQYKNADFVAETDFHHLIKNFVGEIATTIIMGRDFMANYPSVVNDLWIADSKFNEFLLGLPRWFPGMIGPAAARDRIVDAVTEHHNAYVKYLDGKDPGSKWTDMSDVSNVIADRIRLLTADSISPKARAIVNATVFWAMNINSNQVIFWMLYYFYRDPTLLAQIRAEVAPYVQKQTPSSEDKLAIKEPPRLKINLEGLRHSCPLLQGSFLETMRLEASSASYKYIDSDFVLTEPAEDVKIISNGTKDTAINHLFPKGAYLCIPHGAHQNDSRYWPEPEKFDPQRFWMSSSEKSTNEISENYDKPATGAKEEIRVDLKTMKVWGGGKTMCRGKKFAEAEVLLFIAAIVTCWEVEPVEGAKGWKHPGRVYGPGAVHPKKDIRVRMFRRDW